MCDHHNVWNNWLAQVQDLVCYDEIKKYNKNFWKDYLQVLVNYLSEQKLEHDKS